MISSGRVWCSIIDEGGGCLDDLEVYSVQEIIQEFFDTAV